MRGDSVFSFFAAKLNGGDTLSVGADYYAFHMSRQFFTAQFLEGVAPVIGSGGVVYFYIWHADSSFYIGPMNMGVGDEEKVPS